MTRHRDAIRRHPDGSIDYAHYDRLARRLRGEDAQAVLRALGLGARRGR